MPVNFIPNKSFNHVNNTASEICSIDYEDLGVKSGENDVKLTAVYISDLRGIHWLFITFD